MEEPDLSKESKMDETQDPNLEKGESQESGKVDDASLTHQSSQTAQEKRKADLNPIKSISLN